MEVAGIRAALERDRELTLAQRDQLRRDLDEVFAAAADVATDDEHDPEGATIAYERSRTTALIEQADAHLADIAVALQRLDDGSYGTCVECGGSIADERLRARPAVRTCIACASR
ncbi:MAG: DnaK suppressor protein [Frankiaceae bacterium]|nr:DnaK suppressor protein [Frankiaceae bacterium]